MYEFNEDVAQTYIEWCKSCGHEVQISTQQDIHPEYYTEVNVLCHCGESVKFSLPVN